MHIEYWNLFFYDHMTIIWECFENSRQIEAVLETNEISLAHWLIVCPHKNNWHAKGDILKLQVFVMQQKTWID